VIAALLLICLSSIVALPAAAQASSISAQSSVTASIPRLIRLEGSLVKADGRAVNGSVGVAFSIYADQTGGAPLWQEIQSLSVDRGHYSVLLGSGHPEGMTSDLFV